MLKKILKKLNYILACFAIISFSLWPVYGQTKDDLANQIIAENKRKESTQKSLASAQSLLKSLQNQSYTVSNDITTLRSQITQIEAQVNDVKSKILELEASIAITETELNAKQDLRKEEIKSYFMNSYSNVDAKLDYVFSGQSDIGGVQTASIISQFSIDVRKKSLDDVSAKYLQLLDDKKTVTELKTQLELQNADLAKKKADLETKLTGLNSSITSKSVTVKNLQGEIISIDSNLASLNAAYKRAVDAEKANQVQQIELKAGDYYFKGRGKDSVEGHGMGFSQWGAYGMSLNGWNYLQMINHYYPGTQLSDYPVNSEISIIYCSSDSKQQLNSNWTACASSGAPVVVQRISFDQYVNGIGEIPTSFGPEVAKAQTILARTYAVRVTNNGDPSRPICITAQCQVHLIGNTNKTEYNNATRGKVVTSGGSPIVAYYSASHRGCSSKLSDTWGSTNLSYITNVNDDPWAYKDYQSTNPYNTSQKIKPYNWEWRTNGYSLDKLSFVLSYNTKLNVGTLQKIEYSTDLCGRVKSIKLIGSTGTKGPYTGWYFRSYFNSAMDASGVRDYVYSTEFQFLRK